MKFANARQIIALTLLWTAMLYGADSIMHPRPLAAILSRPPEESVGQSSRPRVTLSLNHLCCTGCLSDLRAALARMPWAGTVRLAKENVPTRSEADAGREPPGGFANRVEIDITRLEGVDFMALESAVRRAGFAIQWIEVSGLSHYHLEADLPHFCCRVCSLAAAQQTAMVKTLRATGRFKWLDSISVLKPRKRLIAYARYGQSANVSEFEEAIERMGFAPSAIRLSIEGDSGRL